MARQLPLTSPPWIGAARKRALFYVLLVLLVAALAGVLTYRFLSNLQRRTLPTSSVVVAAREIRAGERLSPEMVEIKGIPEGVVPSGALRSIEGATGRTAQLPVASGEILLTRDFEAAYRGPLARLEQGTVAVVLPGSWLMSPLPLLQDGDQLDLLAYQSGEPSNAIGRIVEGVEVIGGGDAAAAPSQVVLSLSAEQAVALMYARANGFNLLALMRPRGAD